MNLAHAVEQKVLWAILMDVANGNTNAHPAKKTPEQPQPAFGDLKFSPFAGTLPTRIHENVPKNLSTNMRGTS
nr:hypothetical protein [Ardenticatena sp.]